MSNSYIILGLHRLNYTAIQIELVYISLHAYRSRCGVEVMGNMDCVYLYLGLVKWGGLCCPKHVNCGVSYSIISQSHGFGRASLVL